MFKITTPNGNTYSTEQLPPDQFNALMANMCGLMDTQTQYTIGLQRKIKAQQSIIAGLIARCYCTYDRDLIVQQSVINGRTFLQTVNDVYQHIIAAFEAEPNRWTIPNKPGDFHIYDNEKDIEFITLTELMTALRNAGYTPRPFALPEDPKSTSIKS